MGVSQAEGVEEEAGIAQHIRKRQTERNLLPERVQPCVVNGGPRGVISCGSVLDPVNHIVALVIVHGGDGSDAPAEVFHAAFQRMQFLGFQVRIGLVAAHRIVQISECGHPIGCVVRGINP